MRTPLAFFAYNRPEHTRRALRSLSFCSRLDDVEIFMFSDGPKRPDHIAAVSATRLVLHEFSDSCRATITERSSNFGLAKSIAGAVSDLTKAYGRVIVVEDDLVVAPDFIEFMLDGLDRYADQAEVMQIAGCLLTGPPAESKRASDAFFMPVTTTWGWATWDRAWRLFDPANVSFERLDADPEFRSRFTLDGAGADYLRMLEDRLGGKNDSWGILWWFAVAQAAGQVLYPGQSLVWNGGFDSTGVHCKGTEEFHPDIPELFRNPRLRKPVRYPDAVVTDAQQLEALRRHLAQGDSPLATRISRFVRRFFTRA